MFSFSCTLKKTPEGLLYLYIRNEINMKSFHQDLELVPGAWETGSGQSRDGLPAGMFLRRMGVKQCVLIPGTLMRVVWKMLGSHCPGWFMPQVHLGVISKETSDSQRGRSWKLAGASPGSHRCFKGP